MRPSIELHSLHADPRADSSGFISEEPLLTGSPAPSKYATASVDGARQDEDSTDGRVLLSHPPLFTPIWLKIASLSGFCVLLVLLAVVLGILYGIALNQGGYGVLASDSYSWKYGPTIVLVLVTGLWRQVDYWCKILSPWQALYQRWVSADHSLLLDYVGQIQVLGFWTSLRTKQWPASASIFGVILLRVMTGVSTGLLAEKPVDIRNSSVPLIVSSDPFEGEIGQFNTFATKNPVLTYYGTMAQGLPHPKGTTDTFAVQTFNTSGPLPVGTTKLAANVTGFWPSIQCQEGNINWKLDTPPGTTTDVVTLSFTTADGECSVGKNAPLNFTLLDNRHRILPDRIVYPRMEIMNAECKKHDQDGISYSWFFAILDVHYDQDLVPDAEEIAKYNASDPVVAKSTSVDIQSVTGILCSTQFDFHTANVEINPLDSDTQRGPGLNATPIATIPRIPNWYRQAGSTIDKSNQAWNVLFWSVMVSSEGLLGDDPRTDPESSSLFRLMLAKAGGADYTHFLDVGRLTETATDVFRGVMVQTYETFVGPRNYRSSVDPNILGKAVKMENRLFVQVEPFAIMETCLILMALLTIAILLLGPRNAVPRNPDSLGAVATILASSHQLTNLLGGTGHWDNSRLKTVLDGYRFGTQVEPSEGSGHIFRIQADDEPPVTNRGVSSEQSIGKKKYWKPMGGYLWFRLIMLIIAPVLVALLQVIQFLSDRDNGILEVPNDLSTTLLSRYIPAAVFISVALMYGTFDYGVTSLAPHRSLARGSLSSEQSLFANYVRDLPIVTLGKAISHRQMAVFFSVLTTLAASFLTIIVPALYYIDEKGTSLYTSNVHRSDLFNLTWGGEEWNDDGASPLFHLIEHNNLSSPLFIHKDLVFPTLQSPVFNVSNHLNDTEDSRSRMTLRIPALRPRLNCTILNSSSRLYAESTRNITGILSHSRYWHQPPNLTVPYVNLQTHIDLPSLYPDCIRGGIYGNETVLRFNTTLGFYSEANNTIWGPTYGGVLSDLHVGPVPLRAKDLAQYENFKKWGKEDVYTNGLIGGDYGYYKPGTTFNGGQNPDGCPILGIGFGYFAPGSTDMTKATAGVCDQHVEEVSTEATFLLPGLELDPSRPPVPDESTVRVLGNGRGYTTRQYRPEYQITRGLAAFLSDFGPTPCDTFYQGVLWGVNGVPGPEMVGESNIPRLLNRTNELYAEYMALVITSKMRQAVDKSAEVGSEASRSIEGQDDSLVFEASVMQPVARLKQDRASKLVLQVLLAITFICSSIASFLTWKPAPLMHDPGSIAGAASLLAGSEIASSQLVPDGAEWMSRKEMKDERVFEGMRFRMGWMKSAAEQQTYRIDATD